MSHTPAIALATEIAAQVGSLTLGTNLFHSSIRAASSNIPVDSVFVWTGGGGKPQRTMGDPNEIRRTVLHVRVRDTDYNDGITLAYSILNGLRAQSISTYLDLFSTFGDPSDLGEDKDGNHIFGVTFILVYQEP